MQTILNYRTPYGLEFMLYCGHTVSMTSYWSGEWLVQMKTAVIGSKRIKVKSVTRYCYVLTVLLQ